MTAKHDVRPAGGPARSVAVGIGGVVAAAAVVALLVFLSPYYSTILWWNIRANMFWWLPILLVIAIAILAAARSEIRASPIWILVVLAALGTIGWLFYHTYAQERSYVASVNITSAPVQTLGQRAPFQVASAQARSNLGDVPGDIADTTYLPETDAFATLVEKRGWLTGYDVALSQRIPLTGRGAGTVCRFTDQADARVSGWWSHNLGRIVAEKSRWLRFDNADVYSYCAGQTPKVVVPLKELTGWLVTSERPAGVAIYDGHTGAVTFAESGSVPGPAYPLSLAAHQRESTVAISSWWDWWFAVSGWELDDEATNSGNNSEFVLPVADRQAGQYVTPLTGRGSATAISALSTVSSHVRAGELATLNIHRLAPSWVSSSAISQRIKGDYQDLPNWQNLTIFEIAPLSGNRWVATIGNSQNVLYRVQGNGNLQGTDGTCLYRADNSLIRCGTAADRGGNGVGGQYGPGAGAAPPGDLGSLSDSQLADLQDRVAKEVSRRLRGGK
jgi:hypothetical protein